MANNKHKGRVTLRDVAQHANVSASTVSRALNNHEHVHEATRAIIQKAVEELNYPLERLRSSTAVQKTVALLSRGDFSEGSSDISFGPNFENLVANGVRAVLEARGCNLTVQHSLMTGDDARAVVENFNGSGMIVLGGLADPGLLVVDLDLERSRWLRARDDSMQEPKEFDALPGLLRARRPELYGELGLPVSGLYDYDAAGG